MKPILHQLHWLPIRKRIMFKIILITFKAIHGLAPEYIQDIITIRKPPPSLQLSSQTWLENLPIKLLKTASYGHRAFSACTPQLWNQLPVQIGSINSINLFKSCLKMHTLPDDLSFIFEFICISAWGLMMCVLFELPLSLRVHVLPVCMHLYVSLIRTWPAMLVTSIPFFINCLFAYYCFIEFVCTISSDNHVIFASQYLFSIVQWMSYFRKQWFAAWLYCVISFLYLVVAFYNVTSILSLLCIMLFL